MREWEGRKREEGERRKRRGGVCYIWGSGSTGGPIALSLMAAGKMSYNLIITITK